MHVDYFGGQLMKGGVSDTITWTATKYSAFKEKTAFPRGRRVNQETGAAGQGLIDGKAHGCLGMGDISKEHLCTRMQGRRG